MKKSDSIFVNQPTLPNLDDFIESLKDIWDSKRITNEGKFHKEFEKQLADYLGVKYVSLFVNGTMALISALQVLRITGEVITTHYSLVTAKSLVTKNTSPHSLSIGVPVTEKLL